MWLFDWLASPRLLHVRTEQDPIDLWRDELGLSAGAVSLLMQFKRRYGPSLRGGGKNCKRRTKGAGIWPVSVI